MSKVLRRSDRIRDIRVLKEEAALTVEERVFHHPYLWMEIAQWDIEVFRIVANITKAVLKLTKTHQKNIVKDLLTVEKGGCQNTDTGGIGYFVYDKEGNIYNPFGPHHYHNCQQSLALLFHDMHITGEYFINTTWYQYTTIKICRAPFWFWQAVSTHELLWIKMVIEAYKDNPFADVAPYSVDWQPFN